MAISARFDLIKKSVQTHGEMFTATKKYNTALQSCLSVISSHIQVIQAEKICVNWAGFLSMATSAGLWSLIHTYNKYPSNFVKVYFSLLGLTGVQTEIPFGALFAAFTAINFGTHYWLSREISPKHDLFKAGEMIFVPKPPRSFPSFKREAICLTLSVGSIIAGIYLNNLPLQIGGLLLNVGSQLSSFVKAKRTLNMEQTNSLELYKQWQSEKTIKVAPPKAPLFKVTVRHFPNYVSQFETTVDNGKYDLNKVVLIWETLKSGYFAFSQKDQLALKIQYDKAEGLFKKYQAKCGKPPQKSAPAKASSATAKSAAGATNVNLTKTYSAKPQASAAKKALAKANPSSGLAKSGTATTKVVSTKTSSSKSQISAASKTPTTLLLRPAAPKKGILNINE